MKIKLPDPRTREGIKTIVRFIVGRATSATIVTIVHSNTDPENAYQTASVFIGAHVLGEMVADATAPFVDKQIDEIADAIAEARGQAEIEVEAPTV
jgi:hypothetical protein